MTTRCVFNFLNVYTGKDILYVVNDDWFKFLKTHLFAEAFVKYFIQFIHNNWKQNLDSYFLEFQ